MFHEKVNGVTGEVVAGTQFNLNCGGYGGLIDANNVLYLDEPFGSLDAITRLDMRREIVRIWKTTGKTCLFVTHDVEEACELADRVAVMSRRPGTIRAAVDVALPRPRDPDTEAFRQLKEHIFDILGVERRV